MAVLPSSSPLLSLLPLLLWAFVGAAVVRAAEYGNCDGCHCIPDPAGTCPKKKPKTNYSGLVRKLKKLKWSNPPSLDCNPYDDTLCDTVPPLHAAGGVCVVELLDEGKGRKRKKNRCPKGRSYVTRTYPGTLEEALEDPDLPGTVTHVGPCGLCSSLQDLAVYMEKGPNLGNESGLCGRLAAQNPQNPQVALQCLRDLGFTEGCATVWFLNVMNTFRACAVQCLAYQSGGSSPIGDPPACELHPCLACDETASGPLFKKFAGRTRRNSGLLASIVRPCGDLAPIRQTNPCKADKKKK